MNFDFSQQSKHNVDQNIFQFCVDIMSKWWYNNTILKRREPMARGWVIWLSP